MYIHLATHSTYSLQEGLMTPAELVQAAQANGMPALGLTDHNLLTGAIEFVTACKTANLQPIIGFEISLNDGPVHLLATNVDGWSNLCRLSSVLALRDDPDAPCSLDTLASHSNNLIALSSQPEQLRDVFRGRLYVSLYDPKQADRLSSPPHLPYHCPWTNAFRFRA